MMAKLQSEQYARNLAERVYRGSDLDEITKQMITHIKENFEKINLPSSGFYIDKILFLDIEFSKLKLTRGSSYEPLPDQISRKKAIINPQNSDKKCYNWAVIASLNHEKIGAHPERISKLKRIL